MTRPQDIHDLADLRIEEAEGLVSIGFPNGAFYLAGYAVELYLKAKICESLKLPNFYDQYAPKSDLSKTFLIHNLERLMLLSGLLLEFEAEKRINDAFRLDWLTIQDWSEKSRYDLRGSRSVSDTTQFITAIKNLIQWIKTH
jgi:hypothetical protein